MSNHHPNEAHPTPEETEEVRALLDRAGAMEREALLAEAEAMGSFPGEGEVYASLLEHMEGENPAAPAGRLLGGLFGGLLVVVAAAALLFFLIGGFPGSKLDQAPAIPDGFLLDGELKLEILQPLGPLSAYGAFAWKPTGSLELSASLSIWDDTPAGRDQPPLVWRGITDNELPFAPGVELPQRIKWQVLVLDAAGREHLRSEFCFAELRP